MRLLHGLWLLAAPALAQASPQTVRAEGRECYLSTPSSIQVEKDPALRLTDTGLRDNALRYAGTYRGVPFLFLVSNCQTELHQLSIILPANEDPWPVMQRLHTIFHMPAAPIGARVRAALKKTDHFSYDGGDGRVEFELRAGGLLQFLSETVEAQR